MKYIPIVAIVLTLTGCCTNRMDTAKVLNKKLEPLPDVTVSRVYLTRSMLPEEAKTDKNGIARFEYQMCITEDFNCWVDSAFYSQNEYIVGEDSSLTFIVDTERMESIQSEVSTPFAPASLTP